MVKKWVVICTICIVIGVVFVNMKQGPKLVSSITTMDTAYLTILVHEAEITTLEKLKKRLIELCENDGFEGIKLHTEDRTPVEKYHISVYVSEKDLKQGKEYLTFSFQRKEQSLWLE